MDAELLMLEFGLADRRNSKGRKTRAHGREKRKSVRGERGIAQHSLQELGGIFLAKNCEMLSSHKHTHTHTHTHTHFLVYIRSLETCKHEKESYFQNCLKIDSTLPELICAKVCVLPVLTGTHL